MKMKHSNLMADCDNALLGARQRGADQRPESAREWQASRAGDLLDDLGRAKDWCARSVPAVSLER